MANDIFIDFEKFRPGLYVLDDTTKAPIGSARLMENMEVTDRGGISPRPGTEVLGAYASSSSYGIRGAFNFVKSFAQEQIIMRGLGTNLEVYSKNYPGAGWFTLMPGFTAGQEFGFATSLVNTDDTDYVVFCNRYEPYMRWNGALTVLTVDLVGGETELTVDSTITPEIYQSTTATSSSSTTLTVTGIGWAASSWNGLYVHIVGTGQISLITDTTDDTITFNDLLVDPGAVAFEIRKLIFSGTAGNLIYAGTEMAFTDIPTSTTITVASAIPALSGTGLAESPEEFTAAPRGNRLTNYLSRIIVGNVRSAVARGNGGALQGYASGGSVFVSNIKDPTDFSYDADRVAGQGDIIAMPYGGGEITDVMAQEDTFYVSKPNYLESIQYTQDANDTADRTPLKSGIGSIGKLIRGIDDIYFVTSDNKFMSIGRIETKDRLPETDNIGFQIKRLLDTYGALDVCGIEHKDKIYLSLRSDPNNDTNDITIVYNRQFESYDGIWNIGASAFFEWGDNNDLYYAEANSGNVYQMLVGTADVAGPSRFPVTSLYLSNAINLAPKIRAKKQFVTSDSQAVNSLYFEGYIRDGTTINFTFYLDFQSSPAISFNFNTVNGSSTFDDTVTGAFLGSTPITLRPMGSISSSDVVDDDGRRHFSFRVYFPFQYAQYFSVGFGSSGPDVDYEIIRYGMSVMQDVTWDPGKIVPISSN